MALDPHNASDYNHMYREHHQASKGDYNYGYVRAILISATVPARLYPIAGPEWRTTNRTGRVTVYYRKTRPCYC